MLGSASKAKQGHGHIRWSQAGFIHRLIKNLKPINGSSSKFLTLSVPDLMTAQLGIEHGMSQKAIELTAFRAKTAQDEQAIEINPKAYRLSAHLKFYLRPSRTGNKKCHHI